MKIFKLWFLVLIWAGFIFWLSSIPNLKTNLECDLILRKIAHVFEYFILTFLLYRAFKGSFVTNVFHLFVYPAVFSFFYAASDEFHQSFVQGRSGSIRDIFIDTVGILGFYMVLKVLAFNQKKIRPLSVPEARK